MPTVPSTRFCKKSGYWQWNSFLTAEWQFKSCPQDVVTLESTPNNTMTANLLFYTGDWKCSAKTWPKLCLSEIIKINLIKMIPFSQINSSTYSLSLTSQPILLDRLSKSVNNFNGLKWKTYFCQMKLSTANEDRCSPRVYLHCRNFLNLI